jgi:putative nucleotidyltransferase with HDIG domain
MKSVLFVDDDPQVLEGLRTRLYRMRRTWEMEFVDTGLGALKALEGRAFDVIVTDQRMPGMDGATLLHIVQERWPQTVRIVLSGYSEPEQTVRLVPVAHQYLSKPCEAVQLETAISRCLALHELLQRPALRELVGRLGALPPAPRTYARLQGAMASETSSMSDIARIVEADTIVSAKLLQTVNSGFFRLPRRVTSVEQGVSYLGLQTVRNLVVSAEVFSKWPLWETRSISFETLQIHASHVAAAVGVLVPPSPVANDAHMAALLHDIGYWVLHQHSGQELAEALKIAREELIPLDKAERRVFGASHAEVGAYLLGIWGFSATVVEAVARHHSPEDVGQNSFDALAALCIAGALVEPGESHAFAGLSVPHSEVSPDYLERVHAPFSWDEAKRRVSSRLSAGESLQ